MSAPVALPDVATQGRSSAIANVSQRSPLQARQNVVPAGQEILLMSAEDLGQFQPMIFHVAGGFRSRSSESSGLAVVRTATSATCR
ncbi:MAG: hypothetical protein JWP08_4129 [Bryobacterales bacterium]|nr:hypothetical protein [Bryobacterales bacterium]